MPDPLVGIVTVTYNSAGVIGPFLASLEGQTYTNFRLYAVDNDSQDGTVELASSERIRIVTIANETNVGVADGNNQGIEAALEDGCGFVLLVNNDTEFGPELVETLVREAELLDADMIVPKIMLSAERNLIWCAGGFFNRKRGYSGEHYGLGQPDTGQFNLRRRIDYAPTCCMLVRREVFTAIGLIDWKYFAYFDDTDFCYRASRCGMRCWYTPATVLYHKVSSLSGGGEGAFFIRYNTRNHVYFLLKNFGVKGAMFLPAYQALILTKWLTGTYTARSFRVAERAFWEGIRLFWVRRESEHAV